MHPRPSIRKDFMPSVVRCPVCKVETSWAENPHRPFCSERCQLIDFGAWTEGRYRIPGEELDQESKEEDGNDEEGSS